MKTTKDINESWLEYDKVVARCHLLNYGKIYLDEYDAPIDNDYLIEEYENTTF